MNYVKTLGLLAITAAALMAFASTASATVTSPRNTVYTGPIKAHAESHTTLSGSVTVTCTSSTVKGKLTTNHAKEASGPVEELTFGGCGPTVTVNAGGTLTLHSSGILTSTGAEVTVLFHSFLLGTLHCVYKTNATDIGDFTDSDETGGAATLDIASKAIPRVDTAGHGACGPESFWSGGYGVTEPNPLYLG